MLKGQSDEDSRVVNGSGGRGLLLISSLYLVFACAFGSMRLDIDEFSFIREPYELVGGDYTVGYIKEHRLAEAAETVGKSYWFYWKYRPLFAPIIDANDKHIFSKEESEFGYKLQESVSNKDAHAQKKYEARKVVPEPNRFYSHGAGKPLLAAILSIPQLALTKAFLPPGLSLLDYQYRYRYHPIFILTRLVQILAGLATVWLVYFILIRECDARSAWLGAGIVALFPTSIRFFPNIHHDAILVPFVILAFALFYKRKYTLCGVAFGLALASKNTAIILIPVLFVWSVLLARYAGGDGFVGVTSYWWRKEARPFFVTMLVAIVTLIPFANPISYVEEILTPITHRPYDARGENVESFSLSAIARGTPEDADSPVPRVEWRLTRLLLQADGVTFLFLVLSVFMFCSRRQHPLAVMAFVFLLCTLPYCVEFGDNLMNYRSLVFIPPFAILCALIAPRKYLLSFVAVLAVMDVLYSIDPISADQMHGRSSGAPLWSFASVEAPTR